MARPPIRDNSAADLSRFSRSFAASCRACFSLSAIAPSKTLQSALQIAFFLEFEPAFELVTRRPHRPQIAPVLALELEPAVHAPPEILGLHSLKLKLLAAQSGEFRAKIR